MRIVLYLLVLFIFVPITVAETPIKSPYEKEVLTLLVKANNESKAIDWSTIKNDDLDAIQRLNKRIEESDELFTSIVENFGKGVMEIIIPEQVEYWRLPYEAWSLNELLDKSEKGDENASARALVELFEFERSKDDLVTASGYMLAEKLLDKLIKNGRTEYSIIRKIHRIGPLNARNIDPSGWEEYKEFEKSIRKGDDELLMSATSLAYGNKYLVPIFQQAVSNMKARAINGDKLDRKKYILFSLWNMNIDFFPQPDIDYDQCVEWCKSMALDGDVLSRWLWTNDFRSTKLDESDIELLFAYYKDLLESGFFLLQPLGFFLMEDNSFYEKSLPDTDWKSINEDMEKQKLNRGFVDSLSKNLHIKRNDYIFGTYTKGSVKPILEKLYESGSIAEFINDIEFYIDLEESENDFFDFIKDKADKGDPDFLTILGDIYSEKFGSRVQLSKDIEKARKYYRKAFDILSNEPYCNATLFDKKRKILRQNLQTETLHQR